MRNHEPIPLAEAVADRAIIRSLERATPAETVNAIGHALGYLHELIGTEAGYAAQRDLEMRLRARLDARTQRAILRTGSADAAPLPEAAAWSEPAEAILLDAAQSAALLNAWAPGQEAMHAAAAQLIDGLMALVDGAPAWDQLVGAYFAVEREPAGETQSSFQAHRLQ